MVMYAGKVVEHNSVGEIFRHPRHPYTQGLLKSLPRLDQDTEELATIEGVVPSLTEMPEGCRFCTRCPEATDLCRRLDPGLTAAGEGSVRCWKYRRDGGEG
jgi:peptide/nickel transport system ATP-binding protein/oligopeptide transport system ATP-binding protein